MPSSTENRANRELERTRRHILEAAQRAPRPWRAPLEKLADRIFDREIRLRSLRFEFGVSDRRHSALFFQTFGCDFGQFVTRHRLETGRQLLASTDLKICAARKEQGRADREALLELERKLANMDCCFFL